ncbi:putative DDRGK domain-containing protein 1 [Hypsibius exemplaris]|uniref:DDRGK domain-containing protein 1 n=1 Tax=Hypsibius exemplaris TaxID=2072580 RepID=A0A1W0WNE3_HYPEX|nr:putative DDRGK domain-containing protein 1 [Hypsibius exemplaris]
MDTTSILLAIGFLAFACLAYFLSRTSKKTAKQKEEAAIGEQGERAARPVIRDPVRPGGRVARARPARPTAQAVFDRASGSEDEDGSDGELPDIALDGNIGLKKRRKLEQKAEKRAQRQAELADREEKKEREARLDEERKRKEAIEKLAEDERLEEERLEREERERKEEEEYQKLKASFQIEAEGEEPVESDGENLLQQFIDFIKTSKIVLLEELAAHFHLRTQECIDRVQKLQSEGLLTGVIDDRGKFIYISMEELKAVAKFVKQRGRVSITDLAESSNKLIKLQTDQVASA